VSIEGPAEQTLTEPQLVAWGERVGREAAPPLLLALRGDLGAGKSTLARAIARGLGVTGSVPSPTFSLLHTYATPRGVRLHHLDLYRLESPEEVWELGWAELGASNEFVLVEWPERAESLLAEPRWDILLEDAGAQGRHLRLTPVGAGVAPLPDLPAP
jgi:tRNA threonylcarbamoyladenosine biosynthesis protein TsaE